MGSFESTKLLIDANASKIKSLRYDRICTLREKLAGDIAELMAQAEAADGADSDDGLSLPEEIIRREKLKTRLDAAAKRLEEAVGEDHDGDDPPPPRPEQQTNLTDPDSAIMRKSARHEYRQSYNAQAIVDADGSQMVLATDVVSTTNDRHGFEDFIDAMIDTLGTPTTLLGDAGYAGEAVVEALEQRGIEPLISISRQTESRPYDFRPPKVRDKPPPRITTPWRVAMLEKLQTRQAKEKYRKRKSTVEPVFGIIKSILGFKNFRLRGLNKVKLEWKLVTLAYNCKRLNNLKPA